MPTSPSTPKAPLAAKPAPAQIRGLIQAKYPLISVLSAEEERPLKELGRLAVSLKMRPVYWSSDLGFHSGDRKPVEGLPPARNPDEALSAISDALSQRSGKQTLWVMLDFHPYMDREVVGSGAAFLVRQLKGLSFALEAWSGLQTLVLLGAKRVIPEELASRISVIDWGLPSVDDLVQAARASLTDVPTELKTDMPTSEDEVEELLRSVAEAGRGLTLEEFANAVALSLTTLSKIDREFMLAAKKQNLAKSGKLGWKEPLPGGLASVGGLENLKSWLKARACAFSQEAVDYGLTRPRGIVAAGVSGCGKSYAAGAIAAAWGMPLLEMSMAAIGSKYLGESEQNLLRTLEVARANAPCVLRIDEGEKALAGAGAGGGSDGGVADRQLATLLNFMQESQEGVFIYMTCNSLESLPAELLRKGRFDAVFFIDLPHLEERMQVLSYHLKKRGREPGAYPIQELAQAMEGFSAAEIEGTIEDALFRAYAAGGGLRVQHLVEAIRETVPLSRAEPDKIERQRKAAGRAIPASKPPTQTEETKSRFAGIGSGN